jgi:GNAT superfamily N-acetyltransferase
LEKGGMAMEKTMIPSTKKHLHFRTFPHHDRFPDKIHVRKAVLEDLGEIYNVACSVGKNRKDPYQGFLIDDYTSDPVFFRNFFRHAIIELDHFYIAEAHNRLLGFLMAYTGNQWLLHNPGWLDEIIWHPRFDRRRTENFVVVSKTATRAHLTSRGIGSRLYTRLVADIRTRGIHDIFAETVIDSVPNFASLSFRKKQDYLLAGVRYEKYKNEIITDLIYHKAV